MARKLIWGTFWVLVAVGTGVALSLKPWQVYREQQRSADQAVAEMRHAEKERSELIRQKTELESPIGREKLARERGYRKAGEKPLELDP